MPLDKCTFVLGEQQLSDAIKKTVVSGKNMLYEIPVTFVPGVGAMILPPQNHTPQI
jgi:hypothetical protein